ncbi:ketopantoate reductase family protein [Motiliproteus sp.]|uniref:ketopantoate reductase family protein n=1 Tax=Motiliproteus sp. TaxID=1898955 RepID=UPI003BAC7BBB
MHPTDNPSSASHWHILGAGAIGCLWASHLQLQQQPVSVLVRSDSKLQQFQQPWSLSGQSQAEGIQLQAELNQAESPISRLLVTTKSYDTLAAVEAVRHRLSKDAVIVLLQNGMGQQQLLAEHLSEVPIYVGTTTEGAFLAEQQLIHAGRGESWFGPLNAAAQQLGEQPLQPLLNLDLQSGYDPQVLNRLWQKLAINAAINGLTALHDCQNGILADNPDYRQQMAQLCSEVERLAAALDQPLFDQPLIIRAEAVARATAANFSSMLQDVRHHRRTEIDAINGYLCDQAQTLGIDLPNNRSLVEQIRQRHPSASDIPKPDHPDRES